MRRQDPGPKHMLRNKPKYYMIKFLFFALFFDLFLT